MPAPERPLPHQTFASALNPLKGIVGHYSAAEVDALLATLATGGTIDLAGYATTEQLETTKTEILTAATVAFQERYTKQESDGLFVKKEDMVAPPSLDGYATEQYVDDSIARIPAADLTAYAKLNDTAQAITAKSATAETFTGVAFQFIKENAPNTAFALADVGGQERPVYAVGSKKFPLAFTTEITGSGSVDLSAYAKREDAEQLLLAKTLTAQAIGFGGSILPSIAITYTDTGEGYGERLVVTRGLVNDYLVYKSDLDELNALFPRVQTLENKSVAPQETVDLAPYALKTDLLGLATESSIAATYVTKSDARIYTTAADVAAFVQANYTPKTDFTNLADTVQVIFTNTYTKVETDELLKKYLPITTFTTWGANFYTKQAADAKFQTIADMAIYSQAATVTAQFNAFENNILKPNYALKSEVPGAGVWKDLPLRAGFSTAAVGGRRAQYRIQFGYIELRGEVNRTGDYALDTEYHLATLPAADCPKEWVYGNGATYNGANPALPGVCHVGIKSGGEVIAVPLIRSAIRLYLDNVRVSTFK